MAVRDPAPFYGSPVLTFPVLSAGVACAAGGANTYGVESDVVVTADLVAAGFAGDVLLESVTIRSPSAGETGKVRIGHQTGAGGIIYIAEVDFECATDAGWTVRYDLLGRGGLIPAGADIVASQKTTGGAATITVSVGVMSPS
jgi:hypothetical protein